MSKMRHFAGEGLLRLEQEPPDSHDETPTSSDMNVTPVAVGMNQNSVVCLPMVSESKKLVWVYSHQIDVQMNGAAELDEAFDRFPYPTHRQTAELAERCSLHPDQVRVWFMAQRLRYGISWDYKDIQEVRRKFNSSQTTVQEKEELQNGKKGEVMEDGRKKREKRKRKVKGCGGSAKEKGVRGESVRLNEQTGREMKKEQLVEEDRKDEKSNMQKRKRTRVTEKMGEKRVKPDEEEMTERPGRVEVKSDKVDSEGQKCTKSEEMPRGTKKRNAKVNKILKSIQEVSDAPLALSSLLSLQSETQTSDASLAPANQTHLLQRASDPCSTANSDFKGKMEKEAGDLHAAMDHSVVITNVCKLKDLIEVKSSPATVDNPPTPTTRLHCKTPTQLAMMKMAFLRCQYPDKEDYSRLVRLIGVPRFALVQWFGDMRYFIKRRRPRWMTQKQHCQVLDTIKHHQYMSALTKVESAKSMNAWMTMVEGSKGYSEEENARIPPE